MAFHAKKHRVVDLLPENKIGAILTYVREHTLVAMTILKAAIMRLCPVDARSATIDHCYQSW